jgi:hypothetical protein
VQLQSSLEHGRAAGPRVTDRDDADLHQLFVDVVLRPGERSQVQLRGGRQELLYGSERFVSVREATNNRRAFDVVLARFLHAETRVDAFVGGPVEVDRGAFDDQRIRGSSAWGLYATLGVSRATKLDAYYLGIDNPSATYSQGTARERRHTVGARFFGILDGWDLNHEAVLQVGRFGAGDILAWSVATEQGYTFTASPLQPRLGLRAAIGSGDRNPTDPELNTLSPLFPRGDYFTESTTLGPANFIDIHPSLRVRPTRDWTLEVAADFYWRQSLADGIYNGIGGLIVPGDPALSRRVGTDVSPSATWQINHWLSAGAAASYLFAGPFVTQRGGGDVAFATVWLIFRY